MKTMNSHRDGHTIIFSRRAFLCATAAAAAGCVTGSGTALDGKGTPIAPMGPASRYTPKLKAAFVRRQGEYGMRWPGAVYDGEAALAMYREKIAGAAKELGIDVEILPAPLYSLAEGEQWIARAESEKADGLLLVTLDRQEHAWPTATKVTDSPLPSVIFSPVGTSFTTNTAPLANKQGTFISSTDDFSETIYGMKMIRAGARLRETRFIVIAGKERNETAVSPFGTKLRYVPAGMFLDIYNATPDTEEIAAITDEYFRRARAVHGATRQDVSNGVKSFVVARTILDQEEGDGITMDCLGALGSSKVSLPCIAWSRMLDHGIPAACEADIGACITHALVQYLFNRPGFEQDPVADTAAGCLIGAHCTCPTRLAGFNEPPEPFHLAHHHGNRDAVPITQWRIGERVTVADVLLSNAPDAPPRMIISSGNVVDNVSVPPSGGCVVSVRVKLDGVTDLLAYPGFHQIFFYGDFKKELAAYCKLYGIVADVV